MKIYTIIQRLLIPAALLVVFGAVLLTGASALAQPVSAQEEQSLFFPFDRATVSRFEERLVPVDPVAQELGFRPLLQWRHWANQPKPFGQSLLFVLFYSILSWSAAPAILQEARLICRQRFWSSFGVGLLALAVGLIVVRSSVLSGIGKPLAVLICGVIELALLCGLAVTTSLVGRSLAALLRVDKWPLIAAKQDGQRLAQLLLGALVCALLLQIPGFYLLPKIGTRFVALLAVLGLGGLYRALRHRAE